MASNREYLHLSEVIHHQAMETVSSDDKDADVFDIESFLVFSNDSAQDLLIGAESSEQSSDATTYLRGECLTEHHTALMKDEDDFNGLLRTSSGEEYISPMAHNSEWDKESSDSCYYSKSHCGTDECCPLINPKYGKQQLSFAMPQISTAWRGNDGLERSAREGDSIQGKTPITSSSESTISCLNSRAPNIKKSRKSTRYTDRADDDAETVRFLVVNSGLHICDGYSWLKYGQKKIKNSVHPRSYFRCAYLNCPVKKQVEASSEMQRNVSITYFGRHNHLPPPRHELESRRR